MPITPSNWTYKKYISIDRTKVVGSSHTDFPILINITDTDLRDNANSNGLDIVFTDSDGVTLLDFEIELWVSSTGELVAHIKIPTLTNSSDKNIWMYYGNAGASDLSNPTGVWDSNYKAVYHLNGSYDGTTGEVKDSTSNAFNGTAGANKPDKIDAKIGKGQNFLLADTDSIIIANSTILVLPQSLTVEIWFKRNTSSTPTAGTVQRIYGIYDSGGGAERLTLEFTPSNVLRIASPSVQNIETLANIGVQWNYIVLKYDGTNLKARLNKVEKFNIVQSISSSTTVIIILSQELSTQCGDGIADEFRISSIERSDDWLDTTFNNQNDPSSFYTLGEAIGTNIVEQICIAPSYDIYENERDVFNSAFSFIEVSDRNLIMPNIILSKFRRRARFCKNRNRRR